jgi:hypothetical protein
MDITTVTDVKELKALAYDALQVIEVQQNNLRLVQQRLAELEQEEQTKKK